METAKDKIERLKLKAELFLKEDIKAFVKDIYDNYFFCEIFWTQKDWITVKSFKGKREGEKTRILWIDIEDIKEYREVGK